jgi:hypothetical protein
MTNMILTIPYQAFETGHVHLTPFQMDRYGKHMARLTYKDNSIDFQDVSILSPPLRVIDYNPENSRLRLDLSDYITFQIKLKTLYDYLISTFYIHQYGFLHHKNKSIDFIRNLFYSLLDGMILSLYIYPTTYVKLVNGTNCRITELKSGDMVRCVIRFQGISQLMGHDGFRLRLHHSVPSIWKIKAL